MPMIICPDCQKEMTDAAPACPNCGRPNERIKTAAQRSVGFLLGLGIFLFPIIFSWLTLRKGHTTKARIISFAWLAICIIFYAIQEGRNASTASSPSQQNAVASVQSEPITTSSPQKNTAASTQSEPIMEINIRQILADYKNNEVAADNKYKGNLIQVTGVVDDIKKDILDNLYVTLGTGKQFEIPQIQAFFEDSMNKQLGNLHKGQHLTVVCRVKGLMMNVLGENCAIK